MIFLYICDTTTWSTTSGTTICITSPTAVPPQSAASRTTNFHNNRGYNLHGHGLPAATNLAVTVTTLAAAVNTSTATAYIKGTTKDLVRRDLGHDSAAMTNTLKAIAATINRRLVKGSYMSPFF